MRPTKRLKMHSSRHNFFLSGWGWKDFFLLSPIVFQSSSQCVPQVFNAFLEMLPIAWHFYLICFAQSWTFIHKYINIKCKRGPRGSTHGNICVSLVCVVFQMWDKWENNTNHKFNCCQNKVFLFRVTRNEVLLKQKFGNKIWSWNV
jgi:hypothetical protein